MDKIERFESDGEIHPSKRGGLVCFADHYRAMAESAAKIADLENQLSETMVAHGKTLLLLHTAAYETIPALEAQ